MMVAQRWTQEKAKPNCREKVTIHAQQFSKMENK